MSGYVDPFGDSVAAELDAEQLRRYLVGPPALGPLPGALSVAGNVRSVSGVTSPTTAAALMADLGRLSRERDELADLLDRQRQRYLHGLAAALTLLEARPELEHTSHRAA